MNHRILRDAAKNHPELILPPYDAIIDLNGFDAICAFSDFLTGSTVYIPTKKTIFRKCVEAESVLNFAGDYSICRNYGFTERHYRRIVNR